jgi:hypothetical protein
MRFGEWLDQGNRRNIFWAVIGVLVTPLFLAFLCVLWLAFVLAGAWLGLWPPPFSR